MLRRAALAASLTADERREILRGMVLTRATDNRLKTFFTSGEVRYGDTTFQGKGFRSLGQEAIYAAVIRLRRGETYRVERRMARRRRLADDPRPRRQPRDAERAGDHPAGAVSADGQGRAADERQGPPHRRSGSRAAAGDRPAGERRADHRRHGDGVCAREVRAGSPSRCSARGAPHSASGTRRSICARSRRLPAVFCVQNNQTALSTPVRDQSAVRVFADKASGYGIPGVTIDGTDPDEIAATFAWAVERARAGQGPTLIELVSMRMCGHAHHDDMLYLGKDAAASWSYPPLAESGYADRERHAFWAARDPIPAYAARLEAEGLIDAEHLASIKREAEALVEAQAQLVIAADWPAPEAAGQGVFAGRAWATARRRPRPGGPARGRSRSAACRRSTPGPPFDPAGQTFLEGITLGVGDALRADARAFVFGEDVAAPYGNAFLLLRPLLAEFGDRIVNSILAEGAVLGVCVGAALAGQRPIGEMQFNDFVATGFNMLVNNAAKIRYRWGGAVPMVLRMPWGGLRHAGPYHSQNTEAWFYRTPGLKIVVPSTPARRARADGRGGRGSRSGPLLRAHRALSRSADQAAARRRRVGAGPDRHGGAAPRRQRCRDHLVRRLRPRRAARRRRGSPLTASRPACSTCDRSCRSIATAVLDRRAPLQPRADRPRRLAHRRHRREPRRDHPGRSLRVARRARSASSARSTRRCRTRRRSKSSTWSVTRRSTRRSGAHEVLKVRGFDRFDRCAFYGFDRFHLAASRFGFTNSGG